MAELTLETFLRATAFQMAQAASIGVRSHPVTDEQMVESANRIHGKLSLYVRGDLQKPVDPMS